MVREEKRGKKAKFFKMFAFFSSYTYYTESTETLLNFPKDLKKFDQKKLDYQQSFIQAY